VRWGKPETVENDEYKALNIGETTIFVHQAIQKTVNARIDVVTGGVGTKLIFIKLPGEK
jgi:hypothetical protein